MICYVSYHTIVYFITRVTIYHITLHDITLHYRTPEIDTSEIIVDFQRHVPMDFGGVVQQISLVSGIFQRIVTFPVDVHLNCPMDFRLHFPT